MYASLSHNWALNCSKALDFPHVGFHRLQFKLLQLSEAFPEPIKDDRQRYHQSAQKTQQRVAPAQAERIVHWCAGERKQSANETAELRVGGNRRCRVQRVTINEVSDSQSRRITSALYLSFLCVAGVRCRTAGKAYVVMGRKRPMMPMPKGIRLMMAAIQCTWY